MKMLEKATARELLEELTYKVGELGREDIRALIDFIQDAHARVHDIQNEEDNL